MRRTLFRCLASLCTLPVLAWCAPPAYLPSSAELSFPREVVETAFGLPAGQPRLLVLEQGSSGHINFNLSHEDTPLSLGAQNSAHGVGVHAPSDLLVRLPQPAARFRATVGFDRNAKTRQEVGGRLIFTLEAGGRPLWTSAPLGRDDPPAEVDVPVAGLDEFHLKVRCDGASSKNAHADWVEARLEFADGRTLRLDEFASSSYLLGRLPLSFVLGGESSRVLLDAWPRVVTSHAAADRVVHTLRWRKPDGTFEVRCELTEFLHHPALEWKLHFKNLGPGNSPILEKVLPLDAVISRHRQLETNSAQETVATVLAANGSQNSNADFAPLALTVRRNQPVILGTASGRSSDPYLPFWNFVYGGGYGIVTALGWSGDWQAEVRRLDSMHTNMQAGMANLRLHLLPGEEISSPSVCLLFWEDPDPIRGTNLFRRFLREHIVPTWADGQPPATYAMSGGSSALETVTERNQLDFIRKIAGTGAQTYWLDAGWYQGPLNGPWSKGRGNWFPDQSKFPHGLRPLGDEAHRHGLKFLLWFDPEVVEPGTEIAVQHPEWLLQRDGHGYALFNLGDPAARRFMTDLVASCLKKWDVDIYRNDFNLDPREFWRRADPPDRAGITELRYIEGLYQFWDGLRAAKPGLLIDNCASGGRRIDYETSRRSVPLWRSDYQCEPRVDLHDSAQNHGYGLSLFLPYHGTGQGMTFEPYRDRSMVSSSAVLSLGTPDPAGLADVPFAKVQRVWADAKAFGPLMAYDYYPLTDYSLHANTWMAVQYDHPEAGEGCVIAFRRRAAPFVTAEFTLRAIDASASYRLTFLNTGEQRTVAGSALARLPLQLNPGESSVVLYRRL